MVDGSGSTMIDLRPMNPTIAEAKRLLNLTKDAQLARFLELPRQSMTKRNDEDPMPDAWCWRAAKKRPDLFAPPAAGVAAPKRARRRA